VATVVVTVVPPETITVLLSGGTPSPGGMTAGASDAS
jgi:hypothetical protein